MSFLSPNRLRAKLAPHLHWRVPFEAGVYANSPRWSNKGLCFAHVPVTSHHRSWIMSVLTVLLADLDPVPVHMRTWGGLVSHPHYAKVLPHVHFLRAIPFGWMIS